MTAYEDQVAALAAVLMLGPDLEAVQPVGEWNRTVARGYARRILAAGWRPPDVPPASALSPRAHEAAVLPTPPAGGTQATEGSDG